MSSYIDKINGSCDDIEGVKSELLTISNACYTVGNSTLGDNLRELAMELLAARNSIRKNSEENLNQQFRQTMQSSAKVLNAAIAGRKSDSDK